MSNRALEIAEDMLRAVEMRREALAPAGGMRVPYHGPLASAPPSVLRDVEWWAKEILSAGGQAELKGPDHG